MPYVAMHDEVATFFAGCDIKGGKKKGITFIMNEQGESSEDLSALEIRPC